MILCFFSSADARVAGGGKIEIESLKTYFGPLEPMVVSVGIRSIAFWVFYKVM